VKGNLATLNIPGANTQDLQPTTAGVAVGQSTKQSNSATDARQDLTPGYQTMGTCATSKLSVLTWDSTPQSRDSKAKLFTLDFTGGKVL
jgi:hypothetical protein